MLTCIFIICGVINDAVKADKVRYIGIANCYAYQLAKANALEENIAITPYSALASDRLFKKSCFSMTEISLARLLTKVESPVVGATKFHHIDGAAEVADLTPARKNFLKSLSISATAFYFGKNKPAENIKHLCEEIF